MIQMLMVGLGGFFGAIGRYWISGWVQRRFGAGFPLGTLTVNMLGCFLIGLLMHLVLTRDWISPNQRFLLIVGFLGSLTTFSTFGYETLHLLEKGEWRQCVLSVLLNVFAGLAAVVLGRLLGRMIAG
ncbi:MAG: fluoride efflux transporter CrcB [Acidobacteriota bacterium]|nr:fluoride efflux transporter CrcB [Acidobacteriota bacterium]